MEAAVKGLEKLTSVRLAEVLSQKGTVASEAITDALYAQDKHGEPFVQVLVSGGHITEWDLAKVVTENFQLPFLMASNYQIGEPAKLKIPKELLFQQLIVPLDVFADVVVVVMPVMTSYEVFAKIQKDLSCEIFPYVGLISENQKVLRELFKDFTDWQEAEVKRRDSEAHKKTGKEKMRGDWMSIFDAGDQAIQETLSVKKPTKEPETPPAKKAAKEPATPAHPPSKKSG
jgi:hypothetical protein